MSCLYTTWSSYQSSKELVSEFGNTLYLTLQHLITKRNINSTFNIIIDLSETPDGPIHVPRKYIHQISNFVWNLC